MLEFNRLIEKISSRPWGIFLTILVVCFIGYGATLSYPFMMDDFFVLFGERGIAHKSLTEIFMSEQHIFYRPVGHIYLWISHQLFNANPFDYHLANLFLLFIICVLVYKIAELILNDRMAAFIVSLLYAVHPFNNFLVNYITANVISTSLIVAQISFLYFIKSVREKNRLFYYLSLVSFAFGLFMHETNIMVFVYIILYFYFMERERLKEAGLLLLPCIVMGAAAFYIKKNFFYGGSQISAFPEIFAAFREYVTSVAMLIYWYVGKLLVPYDFIFLWGLLLEKAEFFIFEFIRFILLGVVAVYLIFLRWGRGVKAFALALFITGLFQSFYASYKYFPFVDPFIEPHWFYFSSMGFFILLAVGIVQLSRHCKINPQWFTAGVVLFWLVLLQINNVQWKNQETYCRYWISLNQANTTPFYWLGRTQIEQKNYDEAIKNIKQGIALTRYYSSFTAADLGHAYLLKEDLPMAKRYLNLAISNEENYSLSHYYLGLAYLKEGNKAKAGETFKRAISFYPHDARYSQALQTAENN